jgi:para-nitrobenzyl esterase
VRVKIVRLATIAAAVALSVPIAHAQAGPDQVLIKQGALKGSVEDGAVIFRGIPYAAPPVGDLRWRAPGPPAAWSGIRDATKPGPVCMQPGQPPAAESEDCLSLNVWTPAVKPAKPLPVMVWIHGGGFTGGSGVRFNGTSFVRDGVVLVTLNYRLGRLGFFAHPALAGKDSDGPLADFGLMDQIAALKWVRANIGGFGGDPANVTIFGESAGAMSVNYLITSTAARGLFEKAISESGFARSAGTALELARIQGTAFAKANGITGEDTAAAAALRALPAENLVNNPPGILSTTRIGPIIDGVVARETVVQAFERGDQARVPAIFGGNSFEASLTLDVLKNPDRVLDRVGAHRDQAVALFGGGDPAKAAANIVTLSLVIEPDRFEARQDVKAGAPAWVYYFSYLPKAVRDQVPGAGHSWEIAYVFDRLTKVDIHVPPSQQFAGIAVIPAATPEDQSIASAMHAYWVAFAKTGRPDSAGGPEWPDVKPGSDPVMEFGVGGPAVRPEFKKLQLDIFTGLAERNGGASGS